MTSINRRISAILENREQEEQKVVSIKGIVDNYLADERNRGGEPPYLDSVLSMICGKSAPNMQILEQVLRLKPCQLDMKGALYVSVFRANKEFIDKLLQAGAVPDTSVIDMLFEKINKSTGPKREKYQQIYQTLIIPIASRCVTNTKYRVLTPFLREQLQRGLISAEYTPYTELEASGITQRFIGRGV